MVELCRSPTLRVCGESATATVTIVFQNQRNEGEVFAG